MHTSGAADGPDGALDVQVEGRFEKGLLRRGWLEGHWALVIGHWASGGYDGGRARSGELRPGTGQGW